MEKAVQQQLAVRRQAGLKNQVEELQQQLANAWMHSGPQQRYTYVLSLLIIISEAPLRRGSLL